ncbi:SGNH/GDSL hydrolase family protein [Telmatospirillum siberiense]|uniref:SGNH/GDSL hydrolase family protein n=1 Tax=Telmatospirillum siberiense TaxID=382514 RepID=UPI001F52B574|nr:SGNH/GDSL hydrolase family protein [Telmatospirillum siberiense]
MVQEIRRRLTFDRRFQIWGGCLLAAAAISLSGPASSIEDGKCRIDTESLQGNASLPRTLAALRNHHSLTVVAVGSSSTQGYGASDPTRAYPAQLTALLKAHFPHSAIHILNKGVGGDNIDRMLTRFPGDVFAEKPDLVIWQTGTNDAINHIPIARFRSQLALGLSDLRARGIDVILMTPQYAPQFIDVADHADYLKAMRDAATAANVALFDRFSPSRQWSTDIRFADSPVLTRDGLHQTDAGYHCVATLLADRLTTLAAGR